MHKNKAKQINQSIEERRRLNVGRLRIPRKQSTIWTLELLPVFIAILQKPPCIRQLKYTVLNRQIFYYTANEVCKTEQLSVTLNRLLGVQLLLVRLSAQRQVLLTILIKFFSIEFFSLTPSMPAVPNCCCSKGPAPYWSNPPFLIFDIRALWRSGLSARVPECQKLKNGGLDQYGKV